MKRISQITVIITLSIIFLWSCSLIKSEKPKTSSPPMPPDKQQSPLAELPVKGENPEEEKNQPKPELFSQENEDVQEAVEEEKEQKEGPSAALEEALYAYQDSKLAWDKGDFDTALAALDNAYSLLLKLDLSPDSPHNQEKNELRLLIAQRIQEIYASQLTAVGNNHRSIPLVENMHVLNEIQVFQTEEKERFKEGYKRSGRYRNFILKELKKTGLPEELSWVPMIESWFNPRAYSRASAAGLWQFIASTGYRFGLKRDRYIDERMDPIKSTRAALLYLNELHSHFGDWTTALASYNCGEYKVKKLIRDQRVNYLDNFWDLYIMLPQETRRFVPRFIAAVLIVTNPEKYNFQLPKPDPPLEYETITVDKPIKLADLSKKMEFKVGDLAAINPELRHKSTPDHEYNLRVPVGYGEKTLATLDSLAQYIPPEASYIIHYVKRGETLSKIAQRYNASVSAIARLNRINHVHFIKSGWRLKIPTSRSRSSASIRPRELIKEGEKLVYIVRRGDSLYKIANSFNTTVQKIKEDNNLNSDNLEVGQKIIIQSGIPEGAIVYTVKSGDTPFEIARRNGMNLATFLALNGLSYRSKIYPGQELWVFPKN